MCVPFEGGTLRLGGEGVGAHPSGVEEGGFRRTARGVQPIGGEIILTVLLTSTTAKVLSPTPTLMALFKWGERWIDQ